MSATSGSRAQYPIGVGGGASLLGGQRTRGTNPGGSPTTLGGWAPTAIRSPISVLLAATEKLITGWDLGVAALSFATR